MNIFLLSSGLTPIQIVGCVALIIACVAVVLALLFRKSKYTEVKSEGDAPEALVGEHGIVTETVDTDAGTGLVEIAGEGWAARSVYTDDVYEIGAEVVIVAVEGVKVIVKHA